MHFYSHNIADYRKDTSHLSLLEHGIYRQLLDCYYLNEIPITSDENKLMRLLCVRNANDMQSVFAVLNDFFFLTETGYIHKRCDVEIEKFHAKSKSASNSAKVRWMNKHVINQVVEQEKCERIADAMQTECEGNANSITQELNNSIKKRKKKLEITILEFIQECKDKGERPVRDYLPLWKYQEGAGIPKDFVVLAWCEFERRMEDSGKKYSDWRKAFKNYVEKNYLKLWAITREGEYFLTNDGKQAEILHNKRMG